MKPLLVGEANPYGGDPSYALYPYPRGCSGDRLCRKVMGLEPDDYLERFDRVNLCPTTWSTKVAKERARQIRFERIPDGGAASKIVLLGAKVSRAFGYEFLPFTSRDVGPGILGAPHLRFVFLPHPSGLARAWNEPGALERARAVLRTARVL